MAYDRQKRAFMVKKFHETKSCARVQRAWRTKYHVNTAPDRNAIMLAVTKFESMGIVD